MLLQKIPIGDLLLQQGFITAEQLAAALNEQKTKGERLGKILINSGYINEEKFLTFLAEQLKISFISLTNYPIDKALAQQLPEKMAQRFNAILLSDNGSQLLIGMTDPQDIIAYDELTQFFKRPLELALVRESELQHTFNLVYRRTQAINSFAEELSEKMHGNNNEPEPVSLASEIAGGNTPVTKMLRSIFEDAILVGASDIHLEPDENLLRIRQRVDGVLQEQIIKETQAAQALTQHLKMLAQLNITEKRLPQDGHFSVKLTNHKLDVRLSTLPTQHGESIVLRLLDNSANQLQLEDIGFPNELLQTLVRLIQLPHGMILVTGPTGSGKSTTLYGLLNRLNTPERKIITVEDPVEYQLPRINQVQVNPSIDLGFARILRTALRQDPDVIMVGEIRDKETSTIALRAALTGHLVLATLHTNDALSSVTRLMDLDSEGYLVGGALRAVMAQRLLRRICIFCRLAYLPTPAETAWLAQFNIDPALLQHGKGCSRCNNTGYKGRIGIFELIEFNAAMTEALCRNDLNEFNLQAQQSGYQTLLQSALAAVTQGTTTISEVWRVITGN